MTTNTRADAAPLLLGVRAVCFDLGGTLVRPDDEPTTGQVAALLGIPLPQARTAMERRAKRTRITAEQLAFDIAAEFHRPDLAAALASTLTRARQRAEEPDLYADVAPTLATLRERGIATFALTNSLGSSAPDELPRAFRGLLNHVVYSADTGAVKPERRAFAAVETVSGLRPDELVHVGDSLRADVHGAITAGWRAVWLNRGLADELPRGQTYVTTIRSLEALPLLLPDAPVPTTAPATRRP